MKKNTTKRLFSLFLVLAMLLSMAPQAVAVDSSRQLRYETVENDMTIPRISEPVDVDSLEEEPLYADTDVVRVSIVLEKASTLDAGYSTLGIASNAQAMAYRDDLRSGQVDMTARIEQTIGGKLDVAWNLTLAANIISANVEYGQIESIAQIPGVKRVELEPRYEPAVVSDTDAEPQMISSTPMTGSDLAWAAGYTGAGSRIAVIDTGIDTDHQSFDGGALEYSLACQADLKGISVEKYVESLDLLDAEEVESVKGELNVAIDPELTYVSTKIPFAYNYIDGDYDITHDNDAQGEHGSHVEGIAAANAYIPAEDGTYVSALEAVDVQGVAPDAQIITMKVFGKGGGAYATDYMAAIEDAIVLGCDSVNLSLGSANPGFSTSSFEDVMDSLVESDTVVSISAGNAGSWNDSTQTGVPYLYADDISLDTVGAPGSYTNSLAVASADNTGLHGDYVKVGDTLVFYSETAYTNQPFKTIAGDYKFIFIDGIGTEEEWDAVGDALTGKIAVCSRGTTSFYQKANAAVEHGAIATIVYNNQSGTINMNLEGYLYSNPCVSITQADGAVLKAAAEAVTDDSGNVLYYLGDINVGAKAGFVDQSSDYVTMSSFSSFGVPGSLILKPEITAPGGNIYSVNGSVAGGQAYENMSGTSMAAPQVAGMAALVAQYIRENNLEEVTGLSSRQLTNSLLMSTATPEIEEESGYYWSVLKQGAGLANVNNAITAGSYILMNEDATASYADGKVKAELLDDPDRTGEYSFGFTVNNFSEEDKAYTLNADFFTQDTFAYGEYEYLDTWTTPIAANVTYTVDGVTFNPVGTIACDLDKDGDTDADDAQIILEYCAGNLADIDAIADVSGDGVVATYDAHLILSDLQTRSFTVAQGESVEVQVNVTFSDALKAWLDENYVNGAYVEGYVYAQSVTTADGDLGVTHSIPVMGFYGSWTDASMFDKATYWDYQYGATIPNYTANQMAHIMYVGRKGSEYAYIKQPNPYMIEDEFPAGRMAISRTDTITFYSWNMIRAASAVALVDLAEDGTVKNFITYGNQWSGAFYYSSAGAWQSTSSMWVLFQKIGALDIKEGDVLNLNMVAIPEYYLPSEAATPAEISEVIGSGVLGEGAYLPMPMTVDDTAPEVLGVSKNLLNGDLTITAQDANYIATVQVLSPDGQTVYAAELPEATEAGQITETTLAVGDAGIGSKCIIALGDYAGNETFLEVEYGGKDPGTAGQMYLFTSETDRGDAGWYQVFPDSVYYESGAEFGGMTNVAGMELNVLAAEYVGGYVFVAADDGKFYVTEHGKWDSYAEVGTWQGVASNIYDMAYNPVNGLIYTTESRGMGKGTLYALNPYTGEYALSATITTTNPGGGPPIYKDLRALAIGPDGTFYCVNWGSGYNVYLYTFSTEDIAEGTAGPVAPLNSGNPLNIGTSGRPSMSWNEADGMLYLAGGSSTGTSNKLWVIDPETGAISAANTDTDTYGSGASVTYVATTGLYILPETNQAIQTVKDATSIALDTEALRLITGASLALTASVGPWNLADQSVTWTSSDETVATVDENGVVTGVAAGTATVTAVSNATSDLAASCEVTVIEMPEIRFSAQVTGTDGGSYWADFSTSDVTAFAYAADSEFCRGGALMDDQLYVQADNNLWSLDADSFQITNDYGFLADGWSWSDAAPNPVNEDGYFGNIASVCYNGCYFMVINPNTGNVEYYNLFDPFLTDPMSTLAFVETGVYVDASGNECAANLFYVLTESGELWELALYTPDFGSSFTIGLTHIGSTGIDLYNVSQLLDAYASSVYDTESGYLVVSVSTEGNATKMYLVDPANAVTVELGELDESVASVTTLYQYERATELEVRISDTEARIYEGDAYQLTTKVRPAQYTGGVTWSSSDESVATVSDSGLVTAVAKGVAVITATSEDVNESGEHATATCTVTVEGLVPVNATVSAQIETADGVYWADIDLNTMKTTVVSGEVRKFTGAGYAAGMLWGTDGDFVSGGYPYSVDPANDYAEQVGKWHKNGNEVFLDLTASPAAPFTWNGVDYEAFGYPVSLSKGTIYINSDILGGSATGRGITSTHPGVAAVAFYDYDYVDSSYYHVPVYRFLVLDVRGTLHTFDVTASPASGPFASYFNADYDFTIGILGSIGMKFTDDTALSMTVVRDEEKGINNLIISDSSKGTASLYFVDMNAETLSAAKIGDVPGATDLAGLYSEFDQIQNVADVPHAKDTLSIGENTQLNGLASMHYDEMDNEPVFVVNGNVKTDEVVGSANAVTGETVIEHPAVGDTDVETADGVVKLTLTETEDATNGIIKVSYDPSVLTYAGLTSPVANTAVRVDAETGTVIFDYAAAKALTAGTTLAAVKFTYTGHADTQLTVTTLQRNDSNSVTEEPVTIDVTCSTVVADGYSGDLTWILDDTGVLTFYGEGKMRGYATRTEVPWNAYRAQVTSIVIPEGVTRISDLTFVDMVNLETVVIPETITEIGAYAFKNCAKLTNVVLPAGLTKLGDSAFFGCSSLTEIVIPAGVTQIGAYTFKNCTGLTSVTLPAGLVTVGDSAFYGIAATEFVIPGNVAVVGEYAFSHSCLTEITFVGNAPVIGTDAFNQVVAVANYPTGNETWTEDVMRDYGGTLTWTAN